MFPFLGLLLILKVMALISAKYPDLPEYGVRLDLGYWIETNTISSSNISAQWLPVPKDSRLSDDSHTTDMPSAFLSVQIPYIDSNETGTTFTCSVDARWAVGIYSGGPVGDVDADYVQKATIKNTRPFASDLDGYQYNFLPVDDGSWRRVHLDMDWLYALTPLLGSSTSGWTSLAALLTEIGMDNSTGVIMDWWDVRPMLEVIIATFVADGMSRQGYNVNGGSSSLTYDTLSLLPWDDSESSEQSLLAGTYAFPRPADTVTQLHWSVVVGGYAYKADSLAYYLALTVLFLHSAIALGHVGYVLWTRVCCDAWDSFIGLVVLTAKSSMHKPSGTVDVFKNASVGIKRYQTMSTRVRLRALTTSGVSAAGQEDVDILFGDQTLPVEYGTIEANKAYG